MKTYFDEATDKRLLEAKTEEEVKAIIAETPEAEKLADKTELIMAELARIKGSVDNELDLDELDSAAGGAKRQDITLSETQGCKATFLLEDLMDIIEGQGGSSYCFSNDFCKVSNEYLYHNTRWANCSRGGKHEWKFRPIIHKRDGWTATEGYECTKCGLEFPSNSVSTYDF